MIIPVLFSAPMVHALLAGEKTMTRRLADYKTGRPSRWRRVKRGDYLWVRETVIAVGGKMTFHADRVPVDCAGAPDGYSVRDGTLPSMYMPRWASRLTLAVTAARVERIQDITEADAKAEGSVLAFSGVSGDAPIRAYRTGFVRLWRSLHRDEGWFGNPEVCAISFKVIRANIESAEAKAV